MTAIIDGIRWLISLAKPENLQEIVNLGGPPWVGYAILFAIVFSETGLLVGFFLPGDSLLFAAGLLASSGVFNIWLLGAALTIAAILGDAVNYHVGRQMGERVFERGRIRFIKHDHLLAAQRFYGRYGGKAIVLARFVPLVRTFTPFVAGVARMSYRQFVVYNVAGGLSWVVLMLAAGFWLGQIPLIRDHFETVCLLIVAVSLLPVASGALRGWRHARRARRRHEAASHAD